jgi:hypothetical protein
MPLCPKESQFRESVSCEGIRLCAVRPLPLMLDESLNNAELFAMEIEGRSQSLRRQAKDTTERVKSSGYESDFQS